MGHTFFKKILATILFTIIFTILISIQPAMAQPEELETPLTYEEISTNQLMETISSWAGAWQSQIPDLYISHYVIYYRPPEFDSREQWVENRRTRLIEPEFITLRLIDFELFAYSEKQVFGFPLLTSPVGWVDDGVKEEFALRIESDEFAACAESRVDCDDGFLTESGSEEEFT